MSSSCRNLYAVLGAGALLGLAPRAHAQNWQILPRIEGGGTYNDNYRMATPPTAKTAVYGPYIDAQLDFGLISQRSKLDFVPRVHATYYPSDTADQSTDEYLYLTGEHTGLRSDLKGLAQWSDESVIYSELIPAAFPGVGLGQKGVGEYGRVGVRNRRRMERVAPEYIFDFTQRTHLDLKAQYQRFSFSQSLFQQVGYTDYSGHAGVLFDLTPQSTFSVTGVGSRFLPQRGGHDANRYGVDFEWRQARSQIMTTYLRAGLNRLNSNTVIGTVSTTGFTGGAGVEWRYQITEVVLDVLRNYSPSSAGAELVSDEARFRVLHAFEPRLSGYFAARAVRMRGASSRAGLAISGEDYLAGELGMQYQLTLNSRIAVTYDYTWQRFQTEPSAASNAIAVAFVYQPLSRYQPLPEFTGIPQQEP